MSLQTALSEMHEMARVYGTQMPVVGTTPGTVSVYRHGPRDILMSEELLSKGSTEQIRKVSSHEYYHYLQHNYSMRNMKNKPVTELEAEAMALRWMNSEQPKLPLVPHPAQDLQTVRSLRPLTCEFNPCFSSCGFDATTDGMSKDDGLLDIFKRILGR